MKWDAVTLDSNIFGRYSWDLKHMMIQRLTYSPEFPIQFVLSEVVLREIQRKLVDEAIKARNSMTKAERLLRRTSLLSRDSLEHIIRIFKTVESPEDSTKRLLKEFEDDTQMEIIPEGFAEMKDLVRRYFEHHPPFELSGLSSKKFEFPDAIALLSLEGWAKTQQKKILAISQDSGWIEFARHSSYIDVESDFPKAVERLEQYNEETKYKLAQMFLDMNTGELGLLRKQIADGVAVAVSHMDAYGEGISSFQYESSPARLSLQDFQFREHDVHPEISLWLLERNKITFSIGVSIEAKAECYFLFFRRDPIDKEDVPIGSAWVETDGVFDISIMIEIEGDITATKLELELRHIEIVDAVDRVDFGEIEPDYEKIYYLDRYR